MESAHRTDHPLASSPNKEFIHELEKLTFDSLYSLLVKEGEGYKPTETQQQEQTPVPAPQQPEEAQKAPSWQAERWQVSSWDAYTGAFVPVLMKALGKDPASSATIFITTATDVIGFFVFLGLASVIL
jgi:hypothetical protein